MLGRNLIEVGSKQQQQRLKQQPPRLEQQPPRLKYQPPILKEGEILEENKPKSLLGDLMIDEKKFTTTAFMLKEKDLHCILEQHNSLMKKFHMSECLNDENVGDGGQYDGAAGQYDRAAGQYDGADYDGAAGQYDRAAGQYDGADYSSVPQLSGFTRNKYSERATQLGEYKVGKDTDDKDITVRVSVENITDVPPLCVQNYASMLFKWNTKSFLPTLRYVNCNKHILIIDAYKWSMADIAKKKSIDLFEIDKVDPVLIPFVRKREHLWRLTPLFKKTCKTIIRGLMGLVEIGKPIGSLAANSVVFGEEDTTLQDPKFLDLYEFNEIAGTCDAHSVFCNFLLEIINLNFGMDCKTCFSRKTLDRLEALLTFDLLDIFNLPRLANEKILEHPALMSFDEKMGKYVGIRNFSKDSHNFLFEEDFVNGSYWRDLAMSNLLLQAMFVDPLDTYLTGVQCFVHFIRNTLEHFTANFKDALVNKNTWEKFLRFSQKEINSVKDLHRKQVMELIERVIPRCHIYVFRTEDPDYWMNWRFTSE